MALSFLQRGGNLAESAKGLQLGQYVPEIVLEGLQTGVDNVRTDVYLSPKFVDVARAHISKLLAKYGDVEELVKEDGFSLGMGGIGGMNPVTTAPRSSTFIGAPPLPGAATPPPARPTGFIGSPAVPGTTAAPKTGFVGSSQVNRPVVPRPAAATKSEPADFKRLMADLLVGSLNRAKAENNI